MAGESYQRAYGAMVSVQLLAELEEVVQFKMMPDRRPTLRRLWWDRLQVMLRLWRARQHSLRAFDVLFDRGGKCCCRVANEWSKTGKGLFRFALWLSSRNTTCIRGSSTRRCVASPTNW